MRAIKLELELKTATMPITADISTMVSMFGVPEYTVKKLAAAGAIRKARLGEAIQSPSVYFVQDMLDWLAGQAEEQKSEAPAPCPLMKKRPDFTGKYQEPAGQVERFGAK